MNKNNLNIDVSESHQRLLRVKNATKIGFWELNLTTNELFWSEEIFNIFDIDPSKFEPSYEGFLKIIHPDDRDKVNRAYINSLETQKDYITKHRLLMDDETIKWVREECSTEFDSDGKALISIGIVTDITEEMLYQEQIEKSEKLLHSILNATTDLVFYKDKEFNYLGCNEAFTKFSGKSKEELVGHNDFDLFPEDMASLFREMDIKMLAKNEVSSNYEWIRYPNGDERYVYTQKIPLNYSEEDIGILGIARDVTDLYLIQQKLEEQSVVDELTKAYNRKFYNDRISELISQYKRYSRSFSLLMFDIDDFKKVNDKYGHQVGDKVLKEMTELVKSLIRDNDYLIRLGGEEFAVLLPETHLNETKVVAEKIRNHIENELKTLAGKKITISIGLAEVEQGDSEDSVYKRVDDLLYQSKISGKNRVSS